jgi:hypothetical protein
MSNTDTCKYCIMREDGQGGGGGPTEVWLKSDIFFTSDLHIHSPLVPIQNINGKWAFYEMSQVCKLFFMGSLHSRTILSKVAILLLEAKL